MDDGINSILQLDLIGGRDSARFLLSPIGELRIEFAKTLNYLRAPASHLRFEEVLIATVESTKVIYITADSGWQIVLSRADAHVLKAAIQSNAQSFLETFGDRS
jgi:hypothetical protein